ncbi:carbonic anhydrase [Massilia sp. DWR3-1-1]|uniref:carbonic anhydrase n=1 Tax=Massilia sp. DWR3-1-1 TaxID=2804559 RepID=UPI003CF18A92
MRTLISLFVCCMAAGAAQANDPPAAAHGAPAKAEAPKGELAKAAEAAKAGAAKPDAKADAKADSGKAGPVVVKQTAAAQLAAQRAKEGESEAELSAKIEVRLAAMRANQASRAAAAAKARKTAELQRQREQANAVAMASVAAATPAAPVFAHSNTWSYDGETGPANWGKINPGWTKCGAGNRQSPIDLRDGMKVDLEQIAFDYRSSGFNVIDNGHTIQVGVGLGNYITVQNRTYELQQFHFHRPSEEKINGRGTEMVVHLVHKDGEGNIAVVAVLLERGAANGMIQTVWNNLPLEKNQAVTPVVALDVNDILPKKRDYFTFMGSLTQPPCTEGVLWLVMKQPMPASPAQMALFSRLYPLNARPVQPGGGRVVKESN